MKMTLIRKVNLIRKVVWSRRFIAELVANVFGRGETALRQVDIS
jgi:hypothetical protein